MESTSLEDKLVILFATQAILVAESKTLLEVALNIARHAGLERDAVFSLIEISRTKHLRREVENLEEVDKELAARVMQGIDETRTSLGFDELHEES